MSGEADQHDPRGSAPYARQEVAQMRAEWRAGATPLCPRCETPFFEVSVPPRDDVSYVRNRVHFRCPRCAQSATLEKRDKGKSSDPGLPLVGWREWVRFPDLNLPPLRAKIDTGARTSALHVTSMMPFTLNGQASLQFEVPVSGSSPGEAVTVQAPLVDQRAVRSSSGHSERRAVVQLQLQIGDHVFPAEVTLTRRDRMRFPMLIGRIALERRFLVHPAGSFLQGNLP
jgi:hypothetical protein